jgi:hypothetical protein
MILFSYSNEGTKRQARIPLPGPRHNIYTMIKTRCRLPIVVAV